MTDPTTYGERPFAKIQYGKEVKTTHGTAVAATKILLGDIFPVASDRKPSYPEDALGVRARAMRAIVYQYMAQGTLKISNGYYQALPLLFSCGLKGDVTAAETPPASGAYLWTFTPSPTAQNTPDSITLEYGDNVQAFEVEYMMFQRLKLTGAIAQGQGDSPVSLEAEFFGRQLSTSTFTGALSLPTVQEINAKNARFYRDTTWAGVGGTEITHSIRKFDVEILTGVHPKFLGSAAKYFDVHGEGYHDVKVTLDLEGTDLAEAIRLVHASQTMNVIRISIPGPAIGAGAYGLVVDVSGFWESVTPMASEDKGNNITTAVLHGTYDPTGAKMLAVTATTNANTI